MSTVELTGTKLAHQTRAAAARGISYIFGKKIHASREISRARGAAARV
jgi:hypothetical protein